MKRNNSTIICLAFVLALQLAVRVCPIEALIDEEPSRSDNSTPATASVSTSTTISDSTTSQTSASTTSTTTPTSRIKTTAKPAKAVTTSAPKVTDCPEKCTCSLAEQKVSCEGKKLKVIPNLSKLTSIITVSLYNNSIEELDLTKLPLASLEELDLSFNLVKTFVAPSKGNIPSKLWKLNLRSNRIETLDDFSKIKFPALESLDLSMNPALKVIDASTFNNTKNIRTLKIQQTSLSRLHEFAFAPLVELLDLNISYARLATLDLGPKLFSRNQKLKILDLTNNSLTEVPHVLRSISSIENLILNENLMTSLRQSDFINQTDLISLEVRRCPKLTSLDSMTFNNVGSQLHELILADNPKLQYISKDAFKSDGRRLIMLSDLILSGNNINTLANISEFANLQVVSIDLANNPWDCNCDLLWLNQKRKYPIIKSPLHCNSPPEYKDIEIVQYFANGNCDTKESNRHTLIVALFLLFLLCLTIAVVVQKNDLCRRLLWRDQYGTIYYTKASFPPEMA